MEQKNYVQQPNASDKYKVNQATLYFCDVMNISSLNWTSPQFHQFARTLSLIGFCIRIAFRCIRFAFHVHRYIVSGQFEHSGCRDNLVGLTV